MSHYETYNYEFPLTYKDVAKRILEMAIEGSMIVPGREKDFENLLMDEPAIFDGCRQEALS